MKSQKIHSQKNSLTSHSLYTYLLSHLLWSDPLPLWLDFIAQLISEIQIIAILSQCTFNNFPTDPPGASEKILTNLANYLALSFHYSFSEINTATNIAAGIVVTYIAILILLTLYMVVTFALKTKEGRA